MRNFSLLLSVSMLFICCSGGGAGTLDFNTKQSIDSLTAEGYRLVDIEVQPFCADTNGAQMQRLVDSLLLVREAEMDRLLAR